MYSQTNNCLTEDQIETLDSQFFIQLLKAQENYTNFQDKESRDILLGYYVDCISYFEKKQEQVSIYFQTKIKQIVKQIRIFGIEGRAEVYKNDMSKKIMKQIQQQNIQIRIKETLQNHERKLMQIKNDIQNQYLHLEERIRKSKRRISGTLSGTMSMGSIFSTPEIRLDVQTAKQQHKTAISHKVLFQREIHSQDQSEQDYFLKVPTFE